jgi:hypothetical protein
MDGHANPFSKQTNCFSSPSARGTESFLDRRKPPRKCRLKECPPGEIRYTLICLGEMAPTFEPSRKTLTLPLAGLRRWARPRTSWDAARTNDHGRKLGPNSTRGLATVGWSRQPRPLCPARCLRPWSRPHRIFHHRGSQFCLLRSAQGEQFGQDCQSPTSANEMHKRAGPTPSVIQGIILVSFRLSGSLVTLSAPAQRRLLLNRHSRSVSRAPRIAMTTGPAPNTRRHRSTR